MLQWYQISVWSGDSCFTLGYQSDSTNWWPIFSAGCPVLVGPLPQQFKVSVLGDLSLYEYERLILIGVWWCTKPSFRAVKGPLSVLVMEKSRYFVTCMGLFLFVLVGFRFCLWCWRGFGKLIWIYLTVYKFCRYIIRLTPRPIWFFSRTPYISVLPL